MGILGFGRDSPAVLEGIWCEPKRVGIGGRIRIEATILNPSQEETGALVDFRVHFVKANGSTNPKVFKGGERYLSPREEATVRKTISAQPKHFHVCRSGLTWKEGVFSSWNGHRAENPRPAGLSGT